MISNYKRLHPTTDEQDLRRSRMDHKTFADDQTFTQRVRRKLCLTRSTSVSIQSIGGSVFQSSTRTRAEVWNDEPLGQAQRAQGGAISDRPCPCGDQAKRLSTIPGLAMGIGGRIPPLLGGKGAKAGPQISRLAPKTIRQRSGSLSLQNTMPPGCYNQDRTYDHVKLVP
jgi:hypothetical protein